MRTTDNPWDATICPDCESEMIYDIAERTTRRISKHIQPALDKAIESLEELEDVIRNSAAAIQMDINARTLLIAFADLIKNCNTQIFEREEHLISIDDKLTKAFMEDIESQDNVSQCESCYRQSCDHFE